MHEGTDNRLIRHDDSPAEEKPAVVVYDAQARNRLAFEVTGDDGLKYDTAHVFEPLTDERYLQWIREINLKGTEDEVSEESREASVKLWNDIVPEVENVEYDPESDWKVFIDHQEKIDGLNNFLAVAIVEGEAATGKRKLGGGDTQTIFTECYFNGHVCRQKHVIRKKNFELEKKYSRIQGKRFKQEQIGGLRRKPKVIYIPQDDKIGQLYDEMFISQEGFAGGEIPLRFKTQVIHHVFAPKLDPKK